MSAQNPVSPKVVASTAGAGVGALLSTLILWVLGVLVWGVPGTSAEVANALAAVPGPVAAFVPPVVTVLSAVIPGWRTNDPLRVSPADLEKIQALKMVA